MEHGRICRKCNEKVTFAKTGLCVECRKIVDLQYRRTKFNVRYAPKRVRPKTRHYTCEICKNRSIRPGICPDCFNSIIAAFPVNEARGKVESVLGRRLVRGEVVHHINMNPTDNRNTNLLVCSSEYHAWLHHRYGLRFAELHLRG